MSTSEPYLPASNKEYAEKSYWDERYSREDANSTYDWFQSAHSVALKEITSRLPQDTDCKILNLGCGNSTLSQDLYDAGYKHTTNVDYSEVVIERMKNLYSNCKAEMIWDTGDVRDLKYDTSSFDVIIDKGTMDAMVAAHSSSWDPPAQVMDDCRREMDSALRVLKPDGIFLHITWAQPHFRKRHLEREGYRLEVRKLETSGFDYFLYTVQKVL